MKGKIAAGLVIMILMGTALYIRGQEVTFRATVDRNMVKVGEVVTLTVMVSGNTTKIPKPKLPEMRDFNILSRGSARTFSFVNGKIQTSVSYTYSLAPKKKGKCTIGECEIVLKGKTYRTVPIEIVGVEQGEKESEREKEKTGENAGSDIFIETFVDKNRIFVGEQIILTFRLYSAVRIMGNLQYIPPTTEDFWRENLGEEMQRKEIIKGREYHVNEINYAIFPITAGEKSIGEAYLNAVIEEVIKDPFDFGISSRTRKQLVSKPIPILILPLPEAPDDFSNGVGNFDIHIRLDNDSTKQHEPLTVITTVQGDGNIREVELREMDIPGFSIYNSGSSVNIKEAGGKLQGTKTFKSILIPRKSGDFEIPERTFIFFNPLTRKFVTKKTERISFTITPGEEGEASEKVFSPLTLEKMGEDIHFIKMGRVLRDHRGLGAVTYLFVLNGVLLCAFLWIAISLELKERTKANEDVIRRRAALSCALRTMEKAKREGRRGDIGEAYELLHKAILQFFADKCDLSIWGMTEDEIMDILRARGEGKEREREIANILQACNRARYSTEKPDLKAFKKHLEKTKRVLRSIKI